MVDLTPLAAATEERPKLAVIGMEPEITFKIFVSNIEKIKDLLIGHT